MYIGNPLISRSMLLPCASAFQVGSGLSAFMADYASRAGADAFAKSAYESPAPVSFEKLVRPRNVAPSPPTEADAQKVRMLTLRLRTARIAGETVYLIAEDKAGTRSAYAISPEDDFELALERAFEHAEGKAEWVSFSKESPETEIRVVGGGRCCVSNDDFLWVFDERAVSSFTSIPELDAFIMAAVGKRKPMAYVAFVELLPPKPLAHHLPILSDLLEAGELFPVYLEVHDYLLRAGFQEEQIESMYSERRREQRERAAHFEFQTGVAVPSIHNVEELRAAVSAVPERLQQYVLLSFLSALDENMPEDLLRKVLVPLLESGEPHVAEKVEGMLLERGMTADELNCLFSPERRAYKQKAVARRHAKLTFEDLTDTPFEAVETLVGLREAVARVPFDPHEYKPVSAGQHFLRALDPHGSDHMIETFVIPLLEDGDIGTAEEAEAILRKRGFTSEQIARLFSEKTRTANQAQEARRRAALQFEHRTGLVPESIHSLDVLRDACAKMDIPELSFFTYCDFLEAFPPDAPMQRLRALVQPLLSSTDFFIRGAAERVWNARAEKGEPLPPVLERVK